MNEKKLTELAAAIIKAIAPSGSPNTQTKAVIYRILETPE